MTITMVLPNDVLGYILNLTGEPARTRLVCRLFNELSDSDILSAAYRTSPLISSWIPASALNVLSTSETNKTLVKRTACCIFRIANYAGIRYAIGISSGNLEHIVGAILTILRQVKSRDFDSIEMAHPLEETSYEVDYIDPHEQLKLFASSYRD